MPEKTPKTPLVEGKMRAMQADAEKTRVDGQTTKLTTATTTPKVPSGIAGPKI